MSSEMKAGHGRRLFLLLTDWTWWAWTLTAVLLAVGLFGYVEAFLAAIGLTAIQTVVMLVRERSVSAFAVQLRLAYLILLVISFIPEMRWLYWLPAVGTFALVIFGYCLMARVLSLFPWNRREPLSADLLYRTLFSRPDLSRVPAGGRATGCAGGLCTIDAQVCLRKRTAEPDAASIGVPEPPVRTPEEVPTGPGVAGDSFRDAVL